MINHASFWGGAAAPYEIEQSLRFDDNDSAHLSRTPGSAGNRQTWTYSGWIKRGRVGFRQQLLNSTSGAYIEFVADNTIRLEEYTGSVQWTLKTNAVYRDNSAWYHIVVAFNSTESTSSNRIKLWINGEQVTSFSGSTYPALNHNSQLNTTSEHRIGEYYTGSSDYLDGYLAEVNFIDGSALDHEDFGELVDNGVWRPIQYAGSYTGQSWYLKFASGDGTDSSGLSNNWTPSGFTTSGTGTDVMSDTPTNNWCTSNALLNNGSSFQNGNLVVVSSTSSTHSTSTFAVSSGKWFWECTPSVGNSWIGVAGTTGGGALVYDNPLGYAYGHTGNKGSKATGSTSYGGASYTGGDVIGVALNLDDGEITFYKNGTSQGVAFTGLSGLFSPASSRAGAVSGVMTHTYNFGQRAFAHTPPTNFLPLNTSNLPAPEIADGSEYFNTVLYSGTGATQSITGVGFQPDLIWFKRRSIAEHHLVQDAIRGVTKLLYPSNTSIEDTRTDQLTSFDTDGFTLGADTAGYTNKSGTYVAWNWLAGNGTSTPTQGTISSTASVNQTAGFSIVSYTGNGTAGATVGHGLGVAPSMIIIKNRDDSASSFWGVYHKSAYVSASDPNVLYLNSTQAQTDDTNVWGSSPDFNSTTFELGDYNGSNGSGDDMIAYCFAEVEGYSKFGSYTGNGSSDGPFVFCGFKPSFVLFKSTGSSTNWTIIDSARSTYNPAEAYLKPNASQAETNLLDIDMLSNGFKLRGTSGGDHNQSGTTFIFAAFAENPFGGSGVSPATAR